MKSEDVEPKPEPILKPGKGPFLTPEKPFMSVWSIMSLVSLLAWPFIAIGAGLSAGQSFSHEFRSFGMIVCIFYPIPIIVGVIGEVISRKAYFPTEIFFTFLSFGSVITVAFVLFFLA